MTWRRGPLAAVLLVVALAGCLDGAPVEPGTGDDDGDPVVHTAPDQFNRTTDSTRFHLHDYWGGQDHLLLMEETRGTSVTTMGQGVNREQFRPPGGHVVPLGTANVTVTLSWELDPGSMHGPVHLYVKTQLDNASQDAGVVQNGEPFTFASSNDQNDLPHQLLSAWSFDLYLTPDPATDMLRFNGEVAIEVVVERGLEIPLFPPHEDRWRNATELPLFADQEQAGHIDHTPAPNRICTSGCLPVHFPVDGAIVPPGAAEVLVVVRAAESLPSDWVLTYHAADTRTFTAVEPSEETAEATTFRIPVDGRVDGPYADSSLWEFQIQTAKTAENGWFYGAYEIEAKALRENV